MSVCGQTTAGSELQHNKQPNCIRVELYLPIAVCLCVNSVGSMSPLLMAQSKHDTLDTAPMKKAKIAQNVYMEPLIQVILIPKNSNCQSVLRMCPHLRSDLKLV